MKFSAWGVSQGKEEQGDGLRGKVLLLEGPLQALEI